jgi:hypothetical protein
VDSFAEVEFTAELVEALAASGVTVEDIVSAHVSCGDPEVFIRTIVGVIPELSQEGARRISGCLSARPAAASAEVAGLSAVFDAASFQNDSSASGVLRDLFVLGPEMLGCSLDAQVAGLIFSDKLLAGGE